MRWQDNMQNMIVDCNVKKEKNHKPYYIILFSSKISCRKLDKYHRWGKNNKTRKNEDSPFSLNVDFW